MPDTIRIMVVEDHHVVRQGRALLNGVPGMQVVAETADGRMALELFRKHLPNIVLMDLRLPGMSGVEAITHIRSQFPEARIIVLTTYDGDEDIHRALDAGARGYLLKGMSGDELMDAIRAVHSGRSRIPAQVAEAAGGTDGEAGAHRSRVGRAARNCLRKIQQGNWPSFEDFRTTVKTHINSILGKLGVTDRTQAVTAAIQRGIVHF